MHVCIFEDTQVHNFFPLAYFRPVFDLRCGALSLREKIALSIPRATFISYTRRDLVECLREEFPRIPANVFPDADVWFVNGRMLADESLSKIMRGRPGGSKVFFSNDEIAVAFICREDMKQLLKQITGQPIDNNIFSQFPSESVTCRLIHYPWDLVALTGDEIEKDFLRIGKKGKKAKVRLYEGTHLLNKKNIMLGNGSVIKPGAVLDAENGPIIIGSNVTIMPNAFIEGPAYIGDSSIVKVGAKIYHGTSIGKHCKVGGEVDASVIQSHSNKQHDGFLGHSYLGSWVNIGADTNTSDLKNTYGNVKMHVNGTMIDTGMQFIGLIMGDHSKTGINVMFDTGTNVGISCNLYGSGLPPKAIPSFSWGSNKSYAVYNYEKSLETARKVMARRNVTMSEAYEILFKRIFSVTAKERSKAGIE